MSRSKKIDYYTLALLKENFPFILLIFANILILIFLHNFYRTTYKKNLLTLKKTNQEIKKMEKAKQSLKSMPFTTEEIERYYQLINTLIPDSESVFKVIAALENLSQSTGFFITNYSLTPLGKTAGNENVLEVTVTGTGNREDFMNLLKNYNFASGRLITMDNLTLSPSTDSTIQLVFKFYSKKVTKPSEVTQFVIPDKAQVEWIKKILTKVKIQKPIIIDEKDYVYAVKPNPFQ